MIQSKGKYDGMSTAFGLNQGPIVLMIENKKSKFVWKLMKKCEFIKNRIRREGFS